MPKNQVVFQIKGLNLDNPPEWLADGYSPNLLNITLEKNVLRKRWGTTLIGDVLAGGNPEVMGGFELLRQSTRHTVRVGRVKVEKLNKVTEAWADITGSDLTGTASDPISFATPLLSGYPILVFTNGVDAIQKYTGTGTCASLGGSPPKAKYLLALDEYLILANVDDGNERSSRVQWCDTGDPEAWTGGNSGSKDLKNEAEVITGIARFKTYAAVHKENAIYLGYKVSSSTVLKFDHLTVTGTICNNTIQNLPNGLQIYLSLDGIRLFNGISSDLIQSPIIEELRQTLNPEKVGLCWSVLVEELDEYWVGVPLSGQDYPETVIKYNYITGAVFKDEYSNCTTAFKYTNEADLTWDDMTITWEEATARWNDSAFSNLFKRVMVNDSSGYSYYSDKSVNDDNSVAIDSYFETKDYITGNLGEFARWGLNESEKPSMEVWAKGNNITVAYSTDSGQTWTDISTLALDSDYPADDSPLVLYYDVLSTKIRFRFRNNTSGETFYLKQFIHNYSLESLRSA